MCSKQSNPVTRSVTDLIRFLKEKHGEPVHLHEKLIPGAFWAAERGNVAQDEDVSNVFIEKLLANDQLTWIWFIVYFERLIEMGLADDAELKSLRSLSPVPMHRLEPITPAPVSVPANTEFHD